MRLNSSPDGINTSDAAYPRTEAGMPVPATVQLTLPFKEEKLQLFDVNLDMLSIFIIDYVNDLAGHTCAQRFHDIGHINAFDLRGEVRTDLHPGVDQPERNLSVTRIRSQRADPVGRIPPEVLAPRRPSVRAESSLVPSSALILPSSIIFKIFMRSSDVVITASIFIL
jgi:hypothetical protein